MDYNGRNTGKIKTGHIYLVGAGPGSSDLITVRGLRLLRRCDTVVYDRLSGEALLSETRPSCEKIYVGKRAGHPSTAQEEINRILVQKAGEGRTVVRLKGGDPFVFGRGGEEAECLMREGIPFTYVPGITSAVAVPGLAGIPVTHRETSRSFHVITAHTTERDPQERERYLRSQIEGLKDAEGTFIFLMGLSSLDMICRLLQESGKPSHFPAAVIAGGARHNETVVRGTISDIGGRVRQAQVSSPALIVAGGAAAFSLRTKAALPLQGMRIGLTGTRPLREKLAERLQEAGAETVCVQELYVRGLEGQERYFRQLSAYTWIVFTSANGARLFLEQMRERHLDIRSLCNISIAVIGSGTADSLRAHGIFPDLMPDIYTAQALAAALTERLDRSRDRVLLYQAREGNPVLEETLRRAGVPAERVAAYTTETGGMNKQAALDTLSYLVFASSSGVKGLISEDPDIFSREKMKHVCAAAIGERTAKSLAAAGCGNILTAGVCTAEGLAEAVIADAARRREA